MVRYVIKSVYTVMSVRHTDLSSVHIESSDIKGMEYGSVRREPLNVGYQNQIKCTTQLSFAKLID